MLTLTDSADDIENKLQKAFVNITWIGELALDRRDFQLIRNAVRSSQPRLVPPRLLLTAMVFCARYAEFSEDENINFWKKFFDDVAKTQRTQSLENEFRSAFRMARATLQEAHEFEFPTRDTTTTDVVSGIYLHAILPAYLQDDFARFFLKQYPDLTAWRKVDSLFPDEIAAQNELTELNAPISKRLIRFVQNPDTSVTAARLIKTLATAALWHSEGLTGDAIASVLSPIERATWTQLLPMLPSADAPETTASRTPAVRARWAWLIQQNDILELHIKNLKTSGDTPPDRVVWLREAEAAGVRLGETVPEYGRRYCEVNAYRAPNGYVIDNAIVIDVDEAGALVAVDIQDRALSLPIPSGAPPTQEAVFFRLQSDGQLAILSEMERLTDGDYAISLREGAELHNVGSGAIAKRYPLEIPKALRAYGHASAGLYSVKLPIQVGQQRINKQRSRISPTLTGANLVAGLAPGALPIYEDGDVWMDFSPPAGVPLDRLFVRLTMDDLVKVHAIDGLDAAGQVMREEGQNQTTLRVRLNDYLPMACLIQAELFSGVSRMHGDPRLAGLLPPGVHVSVSPVDEYYSPFAPPSVRIEGIKPDQIELASEGHVAAENGGVTATWIDPQQDAALRLKFGTTVLPLTFDVKWSFAWVSPSSGRILWEDALHEAVLSVRGEPRAIFYVSVARGIPRQYILNGRGSMDILIKHDALMDMLRAYEGERVQVQAWFAGSDDRIDLFTLIRPQFSDFERQPDIVKGAIRAFKQHLRQARRAAPVNDAHLLPALPREYFDSLPLEALPRILAELRLIMPGSHAETRAAVLPLHTWLLRLPDQAIYSLREDAAGHYFSIDRDAQGSKKAVVRVERHQSGVTLTPSDDHLYQCERCGGLYWSDDQIDKLKHG
ncbi:MAG: hypothetical protein JNL42_12875, partial [Anaerolineae bacterium]|nr:hypothetical protein [Anaerolineae bacterium]